MQIPLAQIVILSFHQQLPQPTWLQVTRLSTCNQTVIPTQTLHFFWDNKVQKLGEYFFWNTISRVATLWNHFAGLPLGPFFTTGSDFISKQCRRRKARTVFSDHQLTGLEKRFEAQRYLSTPERVELASALHLSETQVRWMFDTWFIKDFGRGKWEEYKLSAS